jgi:hypothetical protein
MARASFTLRKTTLDQGSYLQYPIDPAGAASIGDAIYDERTDNDNFLRADDLLLVPTGPGFTLDAGVFEATVLDYRTVRVKWNVQLESTLGETPVPYQAIIKYTEDGASQTINVGETLRESSYSDSVIHAVPEGVSWAYYTLFIRYLSSGGVDDYYEPVASVKVLMPTNYGSTEDLFARIPEHYRWLDNRQAITQDRGPLYRFLSIIGWDLDRTRTLLDYIMTMRDPQIADQEALDALAEDFGIGIKSHELGTQRVRSLIDGIGLIRRGKGTLGIVERTLKSLTGCDVSYDPDTGDIKVYAQRVNLIYDPRLNSGIVGSIDGGNPTSTYGVGFILDSGVVGTAQTNGTYDGGNTPTPDYTGGGTGSLVGGWNAYPDFDNPGTDILERTTPELWLKTGDVLYFSSHSKPDVQSLVQNVYLYIGSYSAGESALVVAHDSHAQVGNTKYWRLEVPEGYEDYTLMNICIRYVEAAEYTIADLDYLLLERNIIGDYFDGDSVYGGWIVDDSGSVSDYSWEGDPAESVSLYTDNFQKMKYVVNNMISSILPVTQLITTGTAYSNRVPTTNLKYNVTYNSIPGV